MNSRSPPTSSSQPVGHEPGRLGGGLDRAAHAEDDVGAGGGEVGADGDGLLAHPLGAEADGRQVVDVLAEAALGGDLREHGEDARVVDAGAEVQHRRDADGLHDLAQAGAGVVEDLGAQVAGLGAGVGGAAGHHDHDVVGDEALDHLDDALVLGDAHVVAADDAGEAAHAAGDDGVVERPERAAVEAALHVVEVLVAEAGDERLVVVGDVDRGRGSGSWRSPCGRSRGPSRGRGARRTRRGSRRGSWPSARSSPAWCGSAGRAARAPA